MALANCQARNESNGFPQLYEEYQEAVSRTVECLQELGHDVSAGLDETGVFFDFTFTSPGVSGITEEEFLNDQDQAFDSCWEQHAGDIVIRIEERVNPDQDAIREIAVGCVEAAGESIPPQLDTDEILTTVLAGEATAKCFFAGVARSINSSFEVLMESS
jgi:hypothetical protein